MLFSAFLAASAATLVVASFEESDDIALRSFTDIEERDELLGGLESLDSRSLSGARSTIARETITATVDMEVVTPMYQEEARGTRGTRRETITATVDMEVVTPMYQEEARGTRGTRRETITATVDMEVATPMDQEEARGTTTPQETTSTRGTRIAGEAIPVPRDTEVATPGMEQISGGVIMAREAILAPRDMEVATPGMEQISGGGIMAREAMSFRDRKA
ncbi:unnamed protein product [Clonostachys chloroleuca]|uniref:Uncharacterized protein n=1 Tax=Clonostachys chloroleuca TaxID=1926264 RepID=A0AA35LUQ5_9HYPO|nr:unnamed protein product [Clonostachys chloroleuca]